MAKTVQQELKELRRKVRRLEGGSKSVEDTLPFLRVRSDGRESFDDQVEKQRHEDVEGRVSRAAAYLDSHPTAYCNTGDSERLAKDYKIPISRAMGLLGH